MTNHELSEEDHTSDLPPYDPSGNYDVAEAHDEEDVPAALERETDDGKGGAVVPKADFVSYAADEDEG